MDNSDTLLECGLGFTCDFEKAEPFVGQEAVLEQKRISSERGGLRRRMASVLVKDPIPLMCHGAVVWRDGERVSDVRVSSYGHTLQGAIGLTMLQDNIHNQPITKDYIQSANWEIEIGARHYKCDVSLQPFYDPKGLKIKT